MAILEISACADTVIPLLKNAYTLQVDAPLILTAGEILSWLEKQHVGGFGIENIECVVSEAMLLILSVRSIFLR